MLTGALMCLMALQAGGREHKPEPTGTITGEILDARTHVPVPGAVVVIPSLHRADTTDSAGGFVFAGVEVGRLDLSVRAEGYLERLYPDVVVKSGPNKPLRIALAKQVVELDRMVVRSSRVARKSAEQSTSVTRLTRDEVLNSPGSSQDVNIMLQTLPAAVGGVDDNTNSFLVRGGADDENVFLIDDIEINTISHWGSENSSSGAIGFLHLDFVRNLDFYAGGFPSRFPPRLSSVVDVAFREGSMSDRKWQFDLNMAGAGFFVEGPIVREKSSYMANVRVSFLDLMEYFLDIGGIPRYQNGQVKLVFNPSGRDKLLLNGLATNETISLTSGRNRALTSEGRLGIGGLQWRRHMDAGMNRLIVSGMYHRSNSFESLVDSIHTFDHLSIRRRFQLKDDLSLFVRENDLLTLGVVVEQEGYDTRFRRDEFYTWARADSVYEYTTNHADTADAIAVVDISEKRNHRVETTGYRLGAHAGYTFQQGWLKLNAGIRDDYFTLLGKHGISPRAGVAVDLGEGGTVSLSGALMHQFPRYLDLRKVLDGDDDYELQRCVQGVIGYTRQFAEVVVGGIEGFVKHYDREPLYTLYADSGKAGVEVDPNEYGEKRAYGVEIHLQKKRRDRFYYALSHTLYSVERQYRDGRWYNDRDNLRNCATIILGSNFHKNHGISARCDLSEGRPYTPIDVAASREAHRTVYDLRGGWLEKRRDPRVKVSLRYSSTNYFPRANLTSYVEIRNLLNRRDVVQEYYSHGDNLADAGTVRYLSSKIFFVGGVTVDF
jgi:hypothetical protein